MNDMKHTYGKLNKFNQTLFLVLSVTFIGLGLVILVGSISQLVNNKISSIATLFWNFVGLAIWSPIVFVFISHITPNVNATDGGLQTIFLFKNLVIAWEDIVEIKPSKPFGLRVGKRASILITRNGLTFFHRIYGLIYGQINQPALLIWSNISDYEALMKRIAENRRKK